MKDVCIWNQWRNLRIYWSVCLVNSAWPSFKSVCVDLIWFDVKLCVLLSRVSRSSLWHQLFHPWLHAGRPSTSDDRRRLRLHRCAWYLCVPVLQAVVRPLTTCWSTSPGLRLHRCAWYLCVPVLQAVARPLTTCWSTSPGLRLHRYAWYLCVPCLLYTSPSPRD